MCGALDEGGPDAAAVPPLFVSQELIVDGEIRMAGGAHFNGWFVMENAVKMDDLGGTPILGNHVTPSPVQQSSDLDRGLAPDAGWV